MHSADRSITVRPVIRFRLKPLARALSGLAGLVPVIAWAQLPSGGQVVAGSAAINQADATHLIVQQGSNRVIVNWQQFSIGEQGYVQFIQPGASAVALNRVVGADPSAILGKLSANGQVFLINPNGVVFGAGAKVDVAGLVATTMNINDDDFMKGDYRLKHGAEKADGAAVVNAGTINTAEGGYVVLAGDYVDNKGVIQAKAGTVLLAAGNALTLQLSGSELVDFAVDEATVVQLAGVKNAGQILASGGRVIMTAKVANDLAATVVNNTGLVEARSTVEKDGVIYLNGEGGSVVNAGTLDASAEAGANGGNIDIRASGDIVHKAGSTTTVSAANTGNSNAGSVYTWADGTNRFEKGAKIEGKGGAEGGNGAVVELSGKAVQIAGDVDVRAPKGKGGSILLDPLNITIVDQDNTAAGGSSVGEQWIEGQLGSGANVSILANGGAGASIALQDLTDGVLDGTNAGGTGGSLTLTASGANSSITFANTSNTIKVDRNLTLNADDGVGGYSGTSISVGNLVAGQGNPTGGGLNNTTVWNAGLTVNAGSVTAESLTLGKAINSNTDSAYTLNARAHDGDLTVNGDVRLEVTNAAVGGVATSATLKADTGDIIVGGSVVSNASGKGYYHYSWLTEGEGDAAPTYYGQAPWELTGQGDHAIDANLGIQAGGNVAIGGAVDVRAIDQSSSFAGNGGYFQTATSTVHIFWRATAADAAAAITAGGNVTVNGATSVVADGYANASYGEIEFWNWMVNQVQLVNQYQNIYQNYGDHDENPATPNIWYNLQSQLVTSTGKGGNTGLYTWGQSGQNANGSGPYTSANLSSWSTGSSGTNVGPMAYTGQAGLTATLAIDAGGDATLNGIDNRAINRSTTGTGSYNDTNWASQDTIGAGLTVSSSRELNYGDTFTTSFAASTASATTAISAGDNRSVQLNGGDDIAYNVIANHANIAASGNTLASAGMTITAGSAGGASGNGTVTLDGPIHVEGADDASINFTVINHDGDVIQAPATTILVKNNYYAHDARATVTSASGDVTLDALTVNAGRAAYLTATADQNLVLTGAQATTASNRAEIDLTATHGALTANDTIAATASSGIALIDLAAATDVLTQAGITASSSTQSHVGLTSGSGAITTNGSILASASSGNGSADVMLAAALGATVNAAVAATANQYTTTGFYPNYVVNGGTASIDIGSANGDIDLNDSVTATGYKTASVDIDADGGAVSLATGKSAAATATGATFGYGYSSWPSYVADVALTAANGMTVDGNVSAVAINGAATTTLNTTGGSAAAIQQGATSTIKADGFNATVAINAGNAAPNSGNAAALDLSGTTLATASTGTASVAVKGAGGTVNAIGATSSGASQVAISTFDPASLLNLTGIGGATASTNAANGADFVVNAAGDIDASQSDLTIKNNNAGASSGARASFASTGGAIDLGAVDVRTTGNGAVLLNAAGVDDVAATGVLYVGANSGTGTIQLTSSAGQTSVGSAGSASVITGNSLAKIDIAGATGVAIDGDLSAQAMSSSATTLLNSGAGDINVADGVGIVVHGYAGTGTLTVDGATAVDFGGDATVTSSTGEALLTLASVGDIDISGLLAANGQNGAATIGLTSDAGHVALTSAGGLTANATTDDAIVQLQSVLDVIIDGAVSATATNGSAIFNAGGDTVRVGSAADVKAIGSASGTLDIQGVSGLQVDGGLLAQSAAGQASISMTTTGGLGATIAQGSGSIVTADGVTASMVVKAGSGSAIDSNNAAALDLDGSINAVASTGAATLLVQSASGQVHAFAATSTGNAASATLTSYDLAGLLELTGTGTVSGALNSATGAVLTIDAAGALDTRTAGLTITNASGLGLAGANATLTAAADAQIGDLAVTANGGDAVLDASGSSLTVTGRLAAESSNGAVTIQLTSNAGNIAIDNTGSVGVTALGQASLLISGATDVTLAGNVNATSTGGDASVQVESDGATVIDGLVSAAAQANGAIIVTSGAGFTVNSSATMQALGDNSAAVELTSTDALILDGDLTASGGGWGYISLTTTGTNASIAQGADSVVTMGGAYSAYASLTSTGAMNIDGDIIAAATDDGTVTGVHTGSSYIALDTTGGATAIITQGSGSVVAAVGSHARVSITAGDSDPAGNPTQAAAFDLNGTLQAIDAIGGSTLSIRGASGSVHDFQVTAGSAPASAIITAYNGDLTLDGTGMVTGNYDSATGAKLAVIASGSLDTHAATLSVTNNDLSSDASAVVILTAQQGSNHLGNVSATVAGAGNASVTAVGATGIVVNGDVLANSTGGAATVDLTTTGGTTATIVQDVGSIIAASGDSAAIVLQAGSQGMVDTAQAAAFDLNGGFTVNAVHGDATLNIEGASGSVHNFDVAATAGTGSATIASYRGSVVLDGSGNVAGDLNAADGAALQVSAATALDSSAATLAVDNTNSGSAADASATFIAAVGSSHLGSVSAHSAGGLGQIIATAGNGLNVADLNASGVNATIDLSAVNGAVELDHVAVVGTQGATLNAVAQNGDLTQLVDSTLGATSANGLAAIDLSASNSMALRDVSATGISAVLNAVAQHGGLTQSAGSVVGASAGSGAAMLDLSSAGAMTIAGNVLAGSGDSSANVAIDSAALTQGNQSLIRASGVNAATTIATGAMALGGRLESLATGGTAALDIDGGAGSVHDFTVASSGGAAHAEIVSGGALLLDGAGAVSGNRNSADGAALTILTIGALNQAGAGIAVTNANSGNLAGAALTLTSGAGITNASAIAVDANGGGAAVMTLHAGGALEIASNLTAIAHNTGAGNGSAAIVLTSGNHAGDAASIHQVAESTILASSVGTDAGSASVLMQAGHCCDSSVELLGATTAEVVTGAGDASISVRGNTIAVQGLTAQTLDSGSTLISLAAPTQVTVNGLLTSEAASLDAQAGIQLVTDKLTYLGAKAELSVDNGHVQLTPFNTTWLIGVESQPDFDSTPQVNYTQTLLVKFTGNGAEIEFGGAYDRSPWVDANGDICVPGMSEWKNIGQHTGDIHVAGAGTGHFQLPASNMVFDTAGTTYYHDNAMSPWSVPTGRVAIYVPRPTPSLDRYFDRTENALQPSVTGLESAAATSTMFQADMAVIVPDGTVQIAGDMFMAGDGVNMVKLLSDGDSSATGGGSGSDSGSGFTSEEDEDNKKRSDAI